MRRTEDFATCIASNDGIVFPPGHWNHLAGRAIRAAKNAAPEESLSPPLQGSG